MSLANRFNSGIFWYGIFTVISRGINVLLLLYFSKSLEIGFFGLLSYTHTTINIFISLVIAGFLTVLSKSVSENRNINPVYSLRYIYNLLIFFLALFVICTIVGFILKHDISILLFSNKLYSNFVPYLILIIVSNSLILFAGAVLIGLEEFRVNSIIQGLYSIIQCIFQLYFTKKFGFEGYVYSSLFISTIFIVPIFYCTYKIQKNKIGNFKIGNIFDLSIISKQLKEGMSIFLSNLLVGFTQWYIMTKFKNEYSFIEVGKLNFINTVRSLLLLFPSIVYSASLPILSNLWGESQKENHHKMTDFSFHLLSKSSILLFCLLLIFSDSFLAYFNNSQIKISFQLFLLATVFSAIGGTFGNVLTSLGKYWYGFFINLIFSIITITSFFLFIKKGIFGVSVAYLISYAASLFYAFYLLYISNVVNKANIFLVLKYSGLATALLLVSIFTKHYSLYILSIFFTLLSFNLFKFLRKYFVSI